MLYKIEWRLLSPLQTMLQSDTIFGHLCWAIAHHFGVQRLEEFLLAMEKPVLTLSSGFPAASLPMPILPIPDPDLDKMKLSEAKQYLANLKAAKKNPWLPIEIWNSRNADYSHLQVLEQTEAIKNLFGREQCTSDLQFHNSINRNTGTTSKGGANLFAEEAVFYKQDTVFESYLSTDYFALDELNQLFNSIENSGFGKNKSTGKGQFRITIEPTELAKPENANAWLLLSNMVPEAKDTQAAYYCSMVKFGKLGGSYAVGKKNPFKKPLMMFVPGSVFLGASAPRGTLVHGIHADDPKLVQHAYAFCLGFHLKGAENA